MNLTHNLFRVIGSDDLQHAEASGVVPRCPSDRRSDCVHLNLKEDVEAVASAYFSPEERPVALEIRHSDIAQHISLAAPDSAKPWQQVVLHQPNILLSSVITVHYLEPVQTGTGRGFKLPAGA